MQEEILEKHERENFGVQHNCTINMAEYEACIMGLKVALLEMPIERPYANRRTFCRCQSKDLLQMPIERYLTII